MYRHRLAHPEPRKRAWTIGGAIHCMVLEPEKFDRRYVVLTPDVLSEIAPSRGSREGKAKVAEHPEWATSNMNTDEYQAACVADAFPGKEALTAKQHEVCVTATGAIREHRTARELLRGGVREEALTWTDAATGLLCKGRLDYLRPDLVIDLKSSRDQIGSASCRERVSSPV